MAICPHHQKQMNDNPDGSAYCTAFVGVGLPGANKKGYCAYRIPKPTALQPPQAPPASSWTPRPAQAPAAMPQADPLPRMRLAAMEAALAFAGALYRGQGSEASDDAVALAERLFWTLVMPAYAGELDNPYQQQTQGPAR